MVVINSADVIPYVPIDNVDSLIISMVVGINVISTVDVESVNMDVLIRITYVAKVVDAIVTNLESSEIGSVYIFIKIELIDVLIVDEP